MKKIILFSAAAAVISGGIVYFYLMKVFAGQNESVYEYVNEFLDESYKQEKLIIEKFPIYEDWIKINDENQLRKYLYSFHVSAAKKFGIGPLKNDDEIIKLISDEKLIRLDDSSDTYYFYGVPEKYRYLTPEAKLMLEKIGRRVNEKLSEKNISVFVKLAVSSAVRPVLYQEKLSKKNSNAVDESTHSYGVSIDFFYDDYYVFFQENTGDNLSAKIYTRLRGRLGFVLGDSLRRQFHSVLASVLLEMQNEGEIFVINEKHQKCFHVTIAGL